MKYNFIRPLLILAVAFATNAIVSLILIGFGVEQELAGNIAYAAAIVAAVLAFVRIRKRSGK